MVSKLFACAMGAAALLAGLTASAAEYRVSYVGTIVEGFDDPGIFGAAGSLAGEAFTATYVYDTLTAEFRTTDPGVSDMIEPVAASLRIKGVTWDFPTSSLIFSYGLAEPGKLTFEQLSGIDANPVDIQSIYTTASSGLFLPDLDLGLGGVFAVDGSGDFGITVCCCPDCGDDFTEIFTGGTLDVDLVRIAVPEPTTWALAIVGFGLAGASLRRRRSVAA